MHELSLAHSILQIVQDHVPPRRWNEVRSVRVDVGRLSGVVADSLEFCFSSLVAATTLQNSRLSLNSVPLRLACAQCQDTFQSDDDIFRCPVCGGSQTTVVSGMELQVKEIELDEELQRAT